MQDYTFDKLRELSANVDGDSLDEKFKKLFDVDHAQSLLDEEEEKYARRELEPKYVIVKEHGRYKFRASYTDMHRAMLSYDEIKYGACDGGGFWGVNGEKKLVTLYDSSSDFGRPKNIEEAIRQDGKHLLEILGKVCDKSGEEHDLSDYQISYIDAIGHRHYVEPHEESDIKSTEGMQQGYAKQGIKAAFSVKRPTNYTPPCSSKDARKKKKAKRHQQKQSRKRNMR